MEVILDNVATGIISTDVKGRMLLLNRAAKDILKVKTDDWMGKPLWRCAGEDFRSIIRPFLKEHEGGTRGPCERDDTLFAE